MQENTGTYPPTGEPELVLGTEEPSGPDWPMIAPVAFAGVAGDFVELATRNSEADPVAVLLTFLSRFGCEISNRVDMFVGDTRHKPLLDVVLVGASSKARKGTSGKPVNRLFKGLFSDMDYIVATHSDGPLSSGEGLIYAIRDPSSTYDKNKGEMVKTDPGVGDKRLWVLDEEFGGILAATRREGNTLSAIMRKAWDGGTISPLTKTSKISATDSCIGWCSHITLAELKSKLDDTEAVNGFGNRILWGCVRRQKLVPFPEPMPESELLQLQGRLGDLIRSAVIRTSPITLSTEVRDAWANQYYPDLTQDRPGLVGCVCNRAEAHALRLAMNYAVLDRQREIGMKHLLPALAVWEFCQKSAEFIFHGRQVDQTSQKILKALEQESEGLTTTEIRKHFSNHITAPSLQSALSELEASGLISKELNPTGGKPSTLYSKSSLPCVLSAKNVLSPSFDLQSKPKTQKTLFAQERQEIVTEVF